MSDDWVKTARRAVARRAAEERGMVPESEWARTDIHKASTYWCNKCGLQLESPHAFYRHLDREHPENDE